MDKVIETQVVNAFMVKRRRERALFALAHEEKRQRFLFDLLEKDNFEPGFMERITAPVASSRVIRDLLKEHGAPDTCYVMRQGSPLDGRTVSLEQGLNELVFHGSGLISCLHGTLAYLEDEVPGSPGPPWRFLLRKRST